MSGHIGRGVKRILGIEGSKEGELQLCVCGGGGGGGVELVFGGCIHLYFPLCKINHPINCDSSGMTMPCFSCLPS